MNRINSNRPTVAMSKLRRIAPRALRVLARHGEGRPALVHFEGTLVPAAEAFIASYDRVYSDRPDGLTKVALGYAKVAALGRRARAWSGALERDVEGFHFTLPSPVPDDVMGSIERLLELVERKTQEGALSYGQALMDDGPRQEGYRASSVAAAPA